MVDSNCIFCKIAAGEIPSKTIYEDEDFRVILDLGAATKGHALILPKNHFDNLFELDDETASKIIPLAKKISTGMKKALNCDGINLVQNNGEEAGQTVMHFHMHIIPRYKGGEHILTWTQGNPTSDEMEEVAECIKENL